jgi:hypothetical protein
MLNTAQPVIHKIFPTRICARKVKRLSGSLRRLHHVQDDIQTLHKASVQGSEQKQHCEKRTYEPAGVYKVRDHLSPFLVPQIKQDQDDSHDPQKS